MISPESFVFSAVAGALRTAYHGIFVSSELSAAPASFPTVTIAEAGNTVYEKMRNERIENAASLMYEVNVYSNRTSGRKQEAKAVLDTIDKQFAALGFTRTMCSPVPNLQDASIYRMTARYMGVAVPEPEGIRIYTK